MFDQERPFSGMKRRSEVGSVVFGASASAGTMAMELLSTLQALVAKIDEKNKAIKGIVVSPAWPIVHGY